MSLSGSAIASGIAGLSISGVSVKNITAIPEQVQPRDTPILFPSPSDWMSGANGEPGNGPATFGTPTTRMWLFNRTFRYVYLHSPVGSGRGLLDNVPAMSDKVDSIVTALLALDITQVDLQTVSIGSFGILQDPAGTSFFGCTIDLSFREKVNP